MTLFRKKKKPKLTLSDVFNPNNYTTISKEYICTICEKQIIGIFETAGNMFSHTDYGWWVRDHHPIMSKGPKHWECYVETEEGKKFAQQCIDGQKEDKDLMQRDSMMRMRF